MKIIIKFIFLLVLGFMLTSCQSNQKKSAKKSAEIYVNLGLAYMKQGRHKLAEGKLLHALELNERTPKAHQYLAEIYRKQGRILIAEESYLRAIKLDKNNASFWNNYAVFLCEEKRYAEADKWFLKAAKKKKYGERDEAYQNAGMCMLEMGDKVRAREYFKSTIGIASRPVALYQIALLDFESGDYASTIEYIERYNKYFKPSPVIVFLRAKTEHALKKEALAHKYLNFLTAQFPNSVEAKQAILMLDQLDSSLIEAPIIRPSGTSPITVVDKSKSLPRQVTKRIKPKPVKRKPANLLGTAQRLLGELGYADVTVSGRMDAPMQKTVLEYQKKEWLSQTGRVDRNLVLHLQVRAMSITPNQGNTAAKKGQTCHFVMEIKQGNGAVDPGDCREDLLPLMRNAIVLYVGRTLLLSPAFDINSIDYDKHAFSIEVPW